MEKLKFLDKIRFYYPLKIRIKVVVALVKMTQRICNHNWGPVIERDGKYYEACGICNWVEGDYDDCEE